MLGSGKPTSDPAWQGCDSPTWQSFRKADNARCGLPSCLVQTLLPYESLDPAPAVGHRSCTHRRPPNCPIETPRCVTPPPHSHLRSFLSRGVTYPSTSDAP